MRSPDNYKNIARWYGPATGWLLRPARERVIRRCRERGFARVLDIGCGTGLLLRDLHAAGLAVTGCDISPSMLARAAADLPASVSLAMCGTSLPFADASFDAATLLMVLHETDDAPETLLTEALRIAPTCLVLDWRMPERNLDFSVQVPVHAIERIAGRRHYSRFRRFAETGYVRGAAMRAGAKVEAEEPLKGGALVLAEVTRA